MEAINQRAQWSQLPEAVRAAIESRLGGRVDQVDPRSGGFTAGMASVLRAGSNTAFVKAIPSSDGQAESYRREAANVAQLPEGVPVPRLLFQIEVDGWVVIAFEAVHGKILPAAMTQRQVNLVVDTVGQIKELLNPSPISGLRTFSDVFQMNVWQRLASGQDAGPLKTDHLTPSMVKLLPRLAELEASIPEAVSGSALLHLDLRHDNLVEDASGKLWLVDWSWPALGAPWVDVASFLPTCSAPDLDRQSAFLRYPGVADVQPEKVDAFIVGLMGHWLENSMRPGFTHAPHLRPYQAASAANAAKWLNQRGYQV